MNVLVVFGTRPEAVKLAPVIRELRRRAAEGRLTVRVCVTAQHREMLDQALAPFGIVPDRDLDLMNANQSPARVAAAILERMEPVFREFAPDWMLVQGDTTTVAAAALAAYYAGVKVGHVEAGLRTGDKLRPFPEEMNRRVAGALADLHFAPTDAARRNLLREGVDGRQVIVTGNPVIDALRWIAAQPPTAEASALVKQLGLAATSAPRLILVTAHRRESFGAPLENVCQALRDLSQRYGGRVRIVYPVHLNPNVQEPARRILGGLGNVSLLPPLGYAILVHLLARAHLVLTDSGGLQEEAPSLGVPVLVLRDVTERPEAVEAGAVRLVGTDRENIVKETVRLLEDDAAHRAMARVVNPYGDGGAAPRIVSALLGEPVKAFAPCESP
jgi:UDP-N-acetylglucosamine 2-epimerase (non-hydrolysing)